MSVVEELERVRVVPVLTIEDATAAGDLAQVLADTGLTTVEVTLRTESALEAIERMSRTTDLFVGAGTVLTADQLDRAAEAGARFAVSPGLDEAVAAHARERDMPYVPGVATATEVQRALQGGSRLLKFFPAEASGGAPAIRALSSPFPDARFMPSGGLGLRSVETYLSIPSVSAVSGAWMLPTTAVRERRWDHIRDLAAATVLAVAEVMAAAPPAVQP